MAKKIIKINRGGAPASSASGPARPMTLAQEEVGDNEELARTQPMRRIVIGGKSQQRRSAMAASAPATRAESQETKKPAPKKKSGPPLWLIPVGIVGLVILVIIISSSGKKPDPYFQGGPVVEQRTQRVLKQNTGPRPMKAYMEKHGPSDMAKARATRMKRKPAGSK
jgi:hypothetical protein